MLSIRTDQLEVLSQDSFQRVLDGWAKELRAEYPEQTLEYSDPQLRELLGHGSERASGYGLTELFHVREYLGLIVLIGSTPAGDPTAAWPDAGLGL